mmetsp:Transcript_9908/g.9762  ORF Transcript_9908/g.9762 Transcript_9908/m.9762 type:complete len:140 (-) Transcript_9908:282-701(-)
MVNLILQLIILLVFPVYDSNLKAFISNNSLVFLMASNSTALMHSYVNGGNTISAFILCFGYYCKITQILAMGPLNSIYNLVAVIAYVHTYPILLTRFVDPQVAFVLIGVTVLCVWSTLQLLEFVMPVFSCFGEPTLEIF